MTVAPELLTPAPPHPALPAGPRTHRPVSVPRVSIGVWTSCGSSGWRRTPWRGPGKRTETTAAYGDRASETVTEPQERPYGTEALFRDDSGNWFSFTQPREGGLDTDQDWAC